MGKVKQTQKLRIGSVRYIHDPNAAQEWFSLFVDLVQAELQHRYSNSCPFSHRIEPEKEKAVKKDEENRCLLPLFDGETNEFH